ncbi:hypothetical protein BH23BAC4_BH23BAC4_08400 [soil metagenome]
MYRTASLILLTLLATGCAATRTSVIPPGATLYANDSRYANIRGSDLFGKVQVLTFFLPGADGHRQALLASERVHRAYLQRDDVEVKAIAVSFSANIQPEGRLIHDLARWDTSMPAYWDRNAEIASAFNIGIGRATSTSRGTSIQPFNHHPGRRIRNMPLTVVLDRDGKVAYRQRGGAASPLHDRRLMQAVLTASQ